jgi:hypothetical protein
MRPWRRKIFNKQHPNNTIYNIFIFIIFLLSLAHSYFFLLLDNAELIFSSHDSSSKKKLTLCLWWKSFLYEKVRSVKRIKNYNYDVIILWSWCFTTCGSISSVPRGARIWSTAAVSIDCIGESAYFNRYVLFFQPYLSILFLIPRKILLYQTTHKKELQKETTKKKR